MQIKCCLTSKHFNSGFLIGQYHDKPDINITRSQFTRLHCFKLLLVLRCVQLEIDLLTSRALRARSAIVQPCLEARSAIVGARASERVARSASERELDLFPLLEIESSDVILARTFQGAKLSQGTQAVKITFRVSYNGFKAALVLR